MFKKKIVERKRVVVAPRKPEPVKVAAKQPVKTDDMCVEPGCLAQKAPGQTHVCARHIRT